MSNQIWTETPKVLVRLFAVIRNLWTHIGVILMTDFDRQSMTSRCGGECCTFGCILDREGQEKQGANEHFKCSAQGQEQRQSKKAFHHRQLVFSWGLRAIVAADLVRHALEKGRQPEGASLHGIDCGFVLPTRENPASC